MAEIIKETHARFNVTLYKIESTHSNVRSDVIKGWCNDLPMVGYPFIMFAEPLAPNADFRYFCSTKIMKIETVVEGKDMFFKTENSIYKLVVE